MHKLSGVKSEAMAVAICGKVSSTLPQWFLFRPLITSHLVMLCPPKCATPFMQSRAAVIISVNGVSYPPRFQGLGGFPWCLQQQLFPDPENGCFRQNDTILAAVTAEESRHSSGTNNEGIVEQCEVRPLSVPQRCHQSQAYSRTNLRGWRTVPKGPFFCRCYIGTRSSRSTR